MKIYTSIITILFLVCLFVNAALIDEINNNSCINAPVGTVTEVKLAHKLNDDYKYTVTVKYVYNNKPKGYEGYRTYDFCTNENYQIGDTVRIK